jgi:hypothetical protein
MNRKFLYNFLFLALCLLGIQKNWAQSIVTTTNSFLNNNGSGTVVFNFENSNPYPILITRIDGVTQTAGTVPVQFLYKTTPNAGVPGTLDSANGWQMVASGSITGIANNTTTVTQQFFGGLSFLIPANTTYAFAIFASGQRYFSVPVGTTTVDSADGCKIRSGNLISYGGGTPPTGPAINLRGWIGSIHFSPAVTCSGTPFPGNAIASVSLACANQTFQLGLQNDSNRLNLSYRWISSSNGLPGTYTFSAGDTTRVLNKTQTATKWYRCIVNCGASSFDTSTSVLVVTPSGAMNGSYTINPSLPISATNFHSLANFAATISCVGITGPVNVTLAPGLPIINGQISFGSISGASSTNTINIFGNGNTVSSTLSPIVSFAGTQFLTWDSLNILGASSFAGFAMHISNQSRYLIIQKSRIDAGNTSISAGNAGIAISGANNSATAVGNNAQYITIRNNVIVGGYFGLTMVGDVGFANNFGHVIENNEFTSFYFYGIYILHGDSIMVRNNDINRFNRPVLSIFYGIFNSNSRYIKIHKNKIHDAGNGAYSCYPIYFANINSTAGFEIEVVNNLVYNNQTSGTYYGIYGVTAINGIKIYHNTLYLNGSVGNTAIKRAIFIATAPNNVDVKNNIIDFVNGSGTKYAIYITTASATFTSNRNVVFNNTTGINHFGYWVANRTTIGDWQTATAQDTNSSIANPAFVNVGVANFIPASNIIDNMGVNVGVTHDIAGASRSTTTPDPGAHEFTSISGDIGISNARIIRTSICYGVNDTVKVSLTNIVGSTIDFSVNPITVAYRINGPVVRIDSVLLNTGTILTNGSMDVTFNNVALNQPGSYSLTAYISPNFINQLLGNDTIYNQGATNVLPILSVIPKTAIATSPLDTFVLNAKSPVFPAGKFFITEVSHYKTAVGAPIGGWPAYLIADDYIEITGVPDSDLAGIILEQWSTTALLSTYTFPVGTKLSPNGTAIIAVGQLGASTPSPANFYYHANYTATFGSTATAGRILRNSGTFAIIDAVAYGTFTFPVAAGVTVADWSGATPAVSSSGNRLVGPDLNTATNWINSGTSPQNPNILNAGVSLPSPASAPGFEWTYLGLYLDTNVNITVGPYTVPGLYTYVANYTNVCGTFRDTVFITASSTVPVEWSFINGYVSNQDAFINWGTASEINTSHFEVEQLQAGKFKAIGKVLAAGNTAVSKTYQFKDNKAFTEDVSEQTYRIKQVDKDGKFSFSKMVYLVQTDNTLSDISIFPNPGKESFTLIGSQVSDATIRMFDMTGKEVSANLLNIKLNAELLEVTNSLSPGIYLVQVNLDNKIKTIKFIKE